MSDDNLPQCYICGARGNWTWISWFVKKNGKKGAFLCRKHELEEVSYHIKGK